MSTWSLFLILTIGRAIIVQLHSRKCDYININGACSSQNNSNVLLIDVKNEEENVYTIRHVPDQYGKSMIEIQIKLNFMVNSLLNNHHQIRMFT